MAKATLGLIVEAYVHKLESLKELKPVIM